MTAHHLIVQSPALRTEQIENLAALAQAEGITRLHNTAARLRYVQHDPETRATVHAWASAQPLDIAYVAAGLKLSDCKVLAMDMDSTLINIECIDEIAGVAGLKAQVAAITEAAMRGEIKDFSDSLRRRVALLKGVSAQALEQVYREKLRLNPGAEHLISTVKQAGLKVLLVSGGFTFFTDRLRDRLKLDSTYANTLEINHGVLTGRVLGDIIDADAKAQLLHAFALQHGTTPAQSIAIGDGANDLKMLGIAGFPVAYHAKPLVQAQTRYTLNVSGLDAVLNWFEHA